MPKAHISVSPRFFYAGFFNRRWTAKCVVAVFAFMRFFGMIASGQPDATPSADASREASRPASASSSVSSWVSGSVAHSSSEAINSPTAVVTGPTLVVRQALREFDRFLDHHPLLEDDLRLTPQHVTDPTFLNENPELKEFLDAHPHTLTGLKMFPRYFLYRALIRQANGPLRYVEIAQIKELLDKNPALERALLEKPQLIREPTFLHNHAALQAFLIQHPTLGRVFLPSPPTS